MRLMMTCLVGLALAGTLLVACSGETTAYTEACSADTPKAYSGYIEQFPDGMHIADVRHRLDLAEYGIAEKEGTAASYEKYIDDHPKGKYYDNALDKAKSLAWGEADMANTVEAMVAFKEKYGTGAYGIKTDARLDGLRYAVTSIQIEELALERVNVGGDRRADPDGWSIEFKAHNGGERTAKVVKMRVVFTDEKGNIIDVRPDFIATPAHPMGIPMPETVKKPFIPGKGREIQHLVGDPNVKKGWPGDLEHLRVEVTEIEFTEG
jgi:hypothetical protein